ncbi:anthranilate synthase component I [Candidatus Oleimmundimicrobium sp.]|uniref:anthranilate synthase component I n=1 Tax=Candidatus Oleimmundimicrobium sp. TaxID=3060597 RepID=UPI0027220CBB|nr:anthranilate synthase component I [Candidatus Oleimmundimicrobium sp.]MDO8886647.1 anthranilate synthase component I [Candidatus Oleimmundimicrobium sp.]
MYYPNFDEFKKIAVNHNLIPVYREINADIETPVSAFQKLGASECSFLLESAEKGERFGRYSFLGCDPYLTIQCENGSVFIKNGEKEEVVKLKNPLDAIRDVISKFRPAVTRNLPPFFGGAVGYLGYDMVKYFEDILPQTAHNDLYFPEMSFFFTDTILIFDHLKHTIKVVANAHLSKDAMFSYNKVICKIDALIEKLQSSLPNRSKFTGKKSCQITSNTSKEDFIISVKKAKEYIKAGDVLQVVLSQRFSTEISSDPFDIYRALRRINPSPYMYYLKQGDVKIIGSSPESLVKVCGNKVFTCPIAGTRPRGQDDKEDDEFTKSLLEDPKERAEHIMLVDLGRNDVGRVSVPGTVKVDDLMCVEKYSHVMHIVSTVTGQLESEKNSFDALQAIFPAGTVSGAPKIRAMEIIDELEPTRRGPYAGAVGYFSYSGDLDSCITIRTIMVHKNKAYVQAGAGIVYDSVPENEYQETIDKAKGMIKAIEMAEEGLV